MKNNMSGAYAHCYNTYIIGTHSITSLTQDQQLAAPPLLTQAPLSSVKLSSKAQHRKITSFDASITGDLYPYPSHQFLQTLFTYIA